MRTNVNARVFDLIVRNAHNVAFTERAIQDRASAFGYRFDVSSQAALRASVRQYVQQGIDRIRDGLRMVYSSTRQKASTALRMHVPFAAVEAQVGVAVFAPIGQQAAEKAIGKLFAKGGYAEQASLISSASARKRFEDQQVQKAMQVLSDEVGKGSIPSEIAGRVATAVGSSHNWNRIVRTEVQRVNNAALQDSYDANTDLIAGQQFVATLDTRTCPVCQAYDGKVYYYKPTSGQLSIDDAPDVPVHPQCRCTFAPVLKTAAELEQAIGLPPNTLSPELDGKATEKLNYDEWIKTQDVETQKNALGERYDKWKEGATLDQMVVGHRTLEPEELAAIEVDKVAKVVSVKPTKTILPPEALASESKLPVSVTPTLPKIAKNPVEVHKKKKKAEPALTPAPVAAPVKSYPWDATRPAPNAFEDELTVDEADAITEWTSWKNKQIRALDKDASVSADREIHDHLRNLKEVLKKAPVYKGQVYRGLSNLSPQDAESFIKPGSSISIEAMSSFSKDKDVAENFARGDEKNPAVLLSYKSSRSFDVSSLSAFQENPEAEVIVAKGTKIVVKSVSEIKDYRDRVTGYTVECEEVETGEL